MKILFLIIIYSSLFINAYSQCDTLQLSKLQRLVDSGRIGMEDLYKYRKLREDCGENQAKLERENRNELKKNPCEIFEAFIKQYPIDSVISEAKLMERYNLQEACKEYAENQIESKEEFINPDGYTSIEVSGGIIGVTVTTVEIANSSKLALTKGHETITQPFVGLELIAPVRNAGFTFKVGGSYQISNENLPESFGVRAALKFFIR